MRISIKSINAGIVISIKDRLGRIFFGEEKYFLLLA